MGRHGHRTDYAGGCELCHQRSMTYGMRLRRRRYAQRVQVDGRWVSTSAPKHGTKTIYVSYGCRCVACSEAQRAYKGQTRDRGRGESDVVAS